MQKNSSPEFREIGCLAEVWEYYCPQNKKHMVSECAADDGRHILLTQRGLFIGCFDPRSDRTYDRCGEMLFRGCRLDDFLRTFGQGVEKRKASAADKLIFPLLRTVHDASGCICLCGSRDEKDAHAQAHGLLS